MERLTGRRSERTEKKGFRMMEADKSAFGNLLLGLVVVAACYLGFMLMTGKLYDPVTAGAAKPKPQEALAILKAGNETFASGQSSRRNADAARLALAGRENQARHAYATILSCSDSRVPVELIFDAGVMELFVVRVAGNVCDTDEIGSIEYGLAHVRTPLLVVLGHTQCGAVSAVVEAHEGHGHRLERHIPPLVDNIVPAVKRAARAHPELRGAALVPAAVEENVWQAVEDLFMKSPAARGLVKTGAVQVAGAVYDVATGKVAWLGPEKVAEILARVESSPEKETEPLAAK
jgi:carbonic anhydrase